MAPNALDGIGMHEAGFFAYKFSGMTNGPAVHEIAVPKPFIREDRAVRVRVPLDEQRQRPFTSISYGEEQALSCEPGNASDNPLHVNGNRLIPLRWSRKMLRLNAQCRFTEDAIHPLTGLLIDIKPITEISATDAGTQTEEFLRFSPLYVGEMAPALHSVRSLGKCALAGGAFKAFPASRIFAVADSTTDAAEPAESHPCRHKHDWKKE